MRTSRLVICFILLGSLLACGKTTEQNRPSFLRSPVNSKNRTAVPNSGELKVTVTNRLEADLNSEINIPERFREPGVKGLLKYSKLLNGTISAGNTESYIISSNVLGEMLREGKNLVVLSFNDSKGTHDSFMSCDPPNYEITVKEDKGNGQFLDVEVTKRNDHSYTCVVK